MFLSCDFEFAVPCKMFLKVYTGINPVKILVMDGHTRNVDDYSVSDAANATTVKCKTHLPTTDQIFS